MVPEKVSRGLETKPLCLELDSEVREVRATRSPTVAVVAPPLMIWRWGVEVKGGGGGSDQDANPPLCLSHVHLAVFQPIVATGGSLTPPGRPRDSPVPSGSAEVPYAICELFPPSYQEHPKKHLQINSTTWCQAATGGAI